MASQDLPLSVDACRRRSAYDPAIQELQFIGNILKLRVLNSSASVIVADVGLEISGYIDFFELSSKAVVSAKHSGLRRANGWVAESRKRI